MNDCRWKERNEGQSDWMNDYKREQEVTEKKDAGCKHGEKEMPVWMNDCKHEKEEDDSRGV